MKRDGEPNPYRPPGVSPEPSAEPAAGPRFWKKRPLIGALDGIAVAVLGLVFLNVTIAEPAGGAKNAMGPRTIVTVLGIALLVGGGGWFAFSLFRLLAGRREGT